MTMPSLRGTNVPGDTCPWETLVRGDTCQGEQLSGGTLVMVGQLSRGKLLGDTCLVGGTSVTTPPEGV